MAFVTNERTPFVEGQQVVAFLEYIVWPSANLSQHVASYDAILYEQPVLIDRPWRRRCSDAHLAVGVQDHALLIVRDQPQRHVVACAQARRGEHDVPTERPGQVGAVIVARGRKRCIVQVMIREQFQLATHKRLLDIYTSSSRTVDALSKLDLPSGVEVEIKA